MKPNHKKFLLTALIVLWLGASGCVKAAALPVNFVAYTKGQDVTSDIAYGPDRHQRLNLYRPRGLEPAAAMPVVVFFYGGGWSSGSKDDYRFVAEPFVSNGYLVVIPDCAKYPQFRYPDFANDSAAAVNWVYRNIPKWGGDRNKILLVGHSSGAHTAALLLTNRVYLERAAVPRKAVLGMAGLAGPYDFVPEEQKYKEIFAPAGGDASSAMPATYIDGTQAPMLLLYGLEDSIVHIRNIRRMQDKVAVHGGRLECKFYQDVGHIGIVTAFSIPLRGNAPVVRDILDFFKTLLEET